MGKRSVKSGGGGILQYAGVIPSKLSANQQFGPVTDNQGNIYPPGTISVSEDGARYARPLSLNQYMVPLYGEHVLLINAQNPMDVNGGGSSGVQNNITTFYLPLISNLHSNVNHNILDNNFGEGDIIGENRSALSDRNSNETINGQPLTEDKQVSFRERFVAPIQPFQGDFITQDRFGSAIRMSGTHVGSNEYSISPFWTGDTNNDPIMTISTGLRSRPGDYYTIETPDNTDSIALFTSTQRINSLRTSQSNIGRGITPLPGYVNSQIILSADRLLFNSKRDEIILSAAKTVSMATPNWAMDMNELFDILEGLITEMSALTSAQAFFGTGVGPTGPASNADKLASLLSRIRIMRQ